eukprot:CAMPEP_0175166468 /NCGR_PEP_ID=MMETSP0087-20121206/27728_1 /TAXON_ID=136419 /ORGANISM="Unknown Unknown, Strain D1" /LENGTH=401 /DNA_ID=CAMNT_0016456099 /DNA_START=15 /DNA_END=1217 /DNA_ORIENTATION=+
MFTFGKIFLLLLFCPSAVLSKTWKGQVDLIASHDSIEYVLHTSEGAELYLNMSAASPNPSTSADLSALDEIVVNGEEIFEGVAVSSWHLEHPVVLEQTIGRVLKFKPLFVWMHDSNKPYPDDLTQNMNTLEDMVFTDSKSLAQFYRKQTNGRVIFEKVSGQSSIGSVAFDCRTGCENSGQVVGKFLKLAKNYIRQRRYDTTKYTNINLIVPQGWAGNAGLGSAGCLRNTQNGEDGTKCWTINAMGANFHQMDILAHELGHNAGLSHAGIPGSGLAGYGDYQGIMSIQGIASNGKWVGMVAPQMFQLGAVAPQNILTVAGPGLHTITSIDLHYDVWNHGAPSKPQLIQIRDNAAKQNYFVSMRSASLGTSDGLHHDFLQGIQVHRMPFGTSNKAVTRICSGW